VLLVKIPIPETNKDVVMVLVGVFASGFTMVLSYFFGSSKGSSDKNDIIQNESPKNNDQVDIQGS